MAKYKAVLSFSLDEGNDTEVMLKSMQSMLISFFNLHPYFFKDVAIDLKKQEENESAS